ncbi:inscuteable -like protein, partial [Asbolus verrucosus]
ESRMSNFKRSPSKMWWISESVEWREVSESPGSQDSGFSDTEVSPTLRIKENKTVVQKISRDIFKEPTVEDKAENLSVNYQEKTTPNKDIKSQINTESPRIYTKNSPKVSRNLFNIRDKKSVKDVFSHQYSKDVTKDTTHLYTSSSEITCSHGYSCVTDENYEILKTSHIPARTKNTKECTFLNRSAPAVLRDVKDDEEISFSGNHSLSSDCESELECLFSGALESPKHTSTPKASALNKMRHTRSKVPLSLLVKCQQKRLILNTREPLENDALEKWMAEIQNHYEQECMTTLQSKSIAGELNQKVAHMATYITTNIRNILSHSECIEMEYKNLSGDKQHIGPLAQSLAGNIVDFLKTYAREINPKVSKLYDAIRKANSEDALQLVPQLFNSWQSVFHEILAKEIKKLVEKLENPCSELDLRATVTATTSLCLRNEYLIEAYIKNDVVPILLILCEKCEGSSMRSLLFRALSTICCSAFAVRQFEKFSGIQIISETLGEGSLRPEPERSEAVALLAQVTAPWIEDNHSIKGLQDFSKKLVKSLTRFTSTTKCCQNLLLCAAALANLSTMDNKSIKYMLHLNTIQVLLEAVNRRGPCVSTYLLEQVATLVANMTCLEAARQELTRLRIVSALLCFLKTNSVDKDVEKRLQQKSIIALSRLCSEREAARQVVELGGVEKLVRLCREKDERFSSDAVLVATLATLRKITDTCGRDVISSEDAQELVEPKLLDSFLAYSTQSESYV